MKLFVDTAGWVAAADASDSLNGQVCRVRDEWLGHGGLLATTDYVIDETLTTIRFRLGLSAAEEWWAQIDGSSRLRTEAVDPSRAELARSIFFRYRDKDFSFTDCTSHFSQMGFTVLPRPD